MSAPEIPFQPYAAVHVDTKGPGDARPTAIQVIKDEAMLAKLTGKTILITGCSSGIGVETARALYETGAKLFLTARDVPKLEKVIEDIVAKAEIKDAPKPEVLELHLDSLESVRTAAEDFKRRSPHLNILINNAGVMASPYSRTRDGHELQIGTNHFAHFLLFQLLKPTLLASAKQSGTTSRVICVSSTGHRYSGIRFHDIDWTASPADYDKWQAYGQSKTANIYMANSITRHYATQNLHGLSLNPGGIATELSRHLNEEDYLRFGADYREQFARFLKSPEQGAATQVWAAVAPRFEEAANCGRYLTDVGEGGPVAKADSWVVPGYAAHAYDPEAEERLWKVSCEVVGVPNED